MIKPLDVMLIAAGAKKPPSDCNTPTSEKAAPVKTMVNNVMRSNGVASECVISSKSNTKFNICPENKTPDNVSIRLSIRINVMNVFARLNAACLSFFKILLNMGMKLAEIAEANVASKKKRGMEDMAVYASA